MIAKEYSYRLRVILAGSPGAGKSAILQCLTGKTPSKASKLSVEGVVDIGTCVFPGIQFTKSKRKDDAVLSFWDYQDHEISATCNRFYLSGTQFPLMALVLTVTD